MKSLRVKIKKFKTIEKIKKNQLEEIELYLRRVREKKKNIMDSMQLTQKKYIDGVDAVNKARSSQDRLLLGAFDVGLDFIKSNWESLCFELKKSEDEEKKIWSAYLAASKELQSIGKILEKYENEFKRKVVVGEQKESDERALRGKSWL